MSVLHNLFFFIVAIGVLVTFHEFGHYWVARKSGVRVLRFSVGFGTPVLRWEKRTRDGDRIEYVIAAIPLGGYVKMLDEREAPVEATERDRAFNNQPVTTRAAIVAAGPVFNFILAILFYWCIYLYGTTVDRALVGEVTPGSVAAQSGFQPRDEVLAVNDTEVVSWNDFRLAVLEEGLDGGDIAVLVREHSTGAETSRNVRLNGLALLKEEGDIIEKLGFSQWWPRLPAIIGGLVADGPAQRAGLQAGDRVRRVGEEKIESWKQLVELIRRHPGQTLDFELERNHAVQVSRIRVGERKVEQQGATVTQGYIGAYQHFPDELREQMVVHVQYGPVEALLRATGKTWDMSILTLHVLWKMLTGEAALANISGPITIATYAGVTAAIGVVSYLSFLAVISVSLGVLNLLPVPMLDGGHLFYYLIEVIKGSPVSQAFELRGQQIGMAILALLMSVAIFNDIQRLIQ